MARVAIQLSRFKMNSINLPKNHGPLLSSQEERLPSLTMVSIANYGLNVNVNKMLVKSHMKKKAESKRLWMC